MKSLLAITTVVLISASALIAGENKCPEAAKAAKACETACAKAKTECAASAKECSKAKECPKAAAALRQTLLTHKGAQLVQR